MGSTLTHNSRPSTYIVLPYFTRNKPNIYITMADARKQRVALKRITTEYKKTSEYYTISYSESNMFACVATLNGPPDTPYSAHRNSQKSAQDGVFLEPTFLFQTRSVCRRK